MLPPPELRKQVSWLDEPVTLGHWRTNAGLKARDDEVDLVVEYDDGKKPARLNRASQMLGSAVRTNPALRMTSPSAGRSVSRLGSRTMSASVVNGW